MCVGGVDSRAARPGCTHTCISALPCQGWAPSPHAMGPLTSCHGPPHLMGPLTWPGRGLQGQPHEALGLYCGSRPHLLWIQAPMTLDLCPNDSGSRPHLLWIYAPTRVPATPDPCPRVTAPASPPPLPGNPARVSVETRVKMKWSICRPGDKGRGSRMGTTNCHGHPGYRVKWRLAGWLIGWLVGLWEAGRW